MPFDGAAWNEAIPVNGDLANEIDDYMRDIKLGVRGRMAQEHVWPSSQAGTSEAGYHKYITFQVQTSAPTLAGTSGGALYVSTDKHLMFEDSAGTLFMVIKSAAGVTFFGGTGTIGSVPYITSGGGVAQLVGSSAGYGLITNSTATAPTWLPVLILNQTNTVTGLTTFATNVNMGANTITNGGLGVSSSTSYHFTSNGVTFTVPTGYYVIGGTRDPDGSFGGLQYARL